MCWKRWRQANTQTFVNGTELKQVLHWEPPVFRRDIRWPNVMCRLHDRREWFIIDWEDASTAPTKAQSHFDHSTHSQRAFVDGHGAEVDIWGVGGMILWCGLHISENLRNLGERMQSVAHPSVQKHWKKSKVFRHPPHMHVAATTRRPRPWRLRQPHHTLTKTRQQRRQCLTSQPYPRQQQPHRGRDDNTTR